MPGGRKNPKEVLGNVEVTIRESIETAAELGRSMLELISTGYSSNRPQAFREPGQSPPAKRAKPMELSTEPSVLSSEEES